MDVIQAAVPLILKALILSARWAGADRFRGLQNIIGRHQDRDVENQFLRDRVFQLETELEICLKQQRKKKPRYSLREQLSILWYREYFQVPLREVVPRIN